MKTWKSNILFVFCFGFLVACENEVEPIDISSLELDYFPLMVDQFVEYQVDSVVYNFQNGTVDTTSSIIRETLVEQFFDTNGDTVYRIERQFKRDETDNWTVIDEWAATRSLTQASRTEENLRFIKLIFPPEPGVSWNGNIHLPANLEINVGGEFLEVYKNWDYKVDELLTEHSIGSFTFPEVLQIIQADDENALELRFSIEKYVKDIGLVYREMRILDTQCIADCEGLPWEEKAEKGFILIQTIRDHN